jgi:maltose alpha-D-glucosyltransferase/alpha-amylase
VIKENFANKLADTSPQAVLARLKIGEFDGFLCDASFTTEFRDTIINRMAAGQDISVRRSEIQFYANRGLRKYLKDHPEIKSKKISSDRSYSAASYDNRFFLKLYGKVDRGINPDLEIARFLSEKVKFKHVPSFIGAIELKSERDNVALGMMQELVENHGDGWTYILERVHNFNERILARDMTQLPPAESKGNFLDRIIYDELPDNLKELLGASAGGFTRLLGKRTGELHLALASDSEDIDFKPESFSLHYQRSLFAGLQSLVRETFSNQNRNLERLSSPLREETAEILSRKNDVLEILKRIYEKKFDAVKIRIHGHYQLGQILLTGKDIAIRDFGGDPATSYSERRLKRSPLRDVAEMIRTFHYAGHAGLLRNNQVQQEELNKLIPFSSFWTYFVTGFFLDAYLESVKNSPLIPKNNDDLNVILQTFLLEKAIYSLKYELDKRPEWVSVPVGIIREILKSE